MIDLSIVTYLRPDIQSLTYFEQEYCKQKVILGVNIVLIEGENTVRHIKLQ